MTGTEGRVFYIKMVKRKTGTGRGLVSTKEIKLETGTDGREVF